MDSTWMFTAVDRIQRQHHFTHIILLPWETLACKHRLFWAMSLGHIFLRCRWELMIQRTLLQMTHQVSPTGSSSCSLCPAGSYSSFYGVLSCVTWSGENRRRRRPDPRVWGRGARGGRGGEGVAEGKRAGKGFGGRWWWLRGEVGEGGGGGFPCFDCCSLFRGNIDLASKVDTDSSIYDAHSLSVLFKQVCLHCTHEKVSFYRVPKHAAVY